MTSKKSKLLEIGKHDRLSALPDEILTQILSCIPTKDAVATSKLSTRWKKVYRSVPVIDLDDYFLAPESGFVSYSNDHISERFTKIVQSVLNSLEVSKILKFCVKCMSMYEGSVMSQWIGDALSRDVEELEISLKNLWRRTSRTGYVFKGEIFTSKTLLSLKLSGFIIDVTELVRLPNLKVMDLRDMIFRVGDDSIPRFFLGFASLEELNFSRCLFENVDLLDLSIPSLKRLVMTHCEGSYRFLLDNPNLEHLECYSQSAKSGNVVKNLNSLIQADVQLYPGRLDEIIDGLCNAKFLSLAAETLDLNFIAFPLFQNLIHLKLLVNCDKQWKFLPMLLGEAPNLQQLVLDSEKLRCKKFSIYQFRRSGKRPICLSPHLRKIEMKNFRFCTCTTIVLKYLLRHGKVLERVIIRFSGPIREDWKEILKYRRSSKTCKIELQYDDNA